MTRLGILGGMGPHATQHFVQILLDTFSRRFHPLRDQEFPDLTVLYECTTPDRTKAIKSDEVEAAARINRDLASLLSMGCNPVAVACITAHALIDPVLFARGVVDFRDSLLRRHTKYGGAPVGVLATDGSMERRIFEPLEEKFKLIYPNDSSQELVMSAIYGEHGLKADPSGTPQCRELISKVIDDLNGQGAEAFLAGCTEMEMFMAENCGDLALLLPMACLCEHLCDFVESAA